MSKRIFSAILALCLAFALAACGAAPALISVIRALAVEIAALTRRQQRGKGLRMA